MTGDSSPAWAKPAPELQWQQTPELEYHQLFRGAKKYRWYKPVIALVLGVLYYITFNLMFSLPVFLILGLTSQGFSSDVLLELALPDTQNPLSIFVALTSIVLIIPAVWLAMLSTGLAPLGRSWSVALRIRWSWMWRTLVPVIVSMVVMNVFGVAFEMLLNPGSLTTSPEATGADIDMQLAVISMALVLVLVPFQATAEELVFRGTLMQTLGGWLGGVKGESQFARFVRGPWLPILVTAFIFGSLHIYDIWGFLAVVAMGVATAYVTWRTGGLEAAIVLHVLNNIVAFGFLSLGVGGETGQTESAGGPGSLIGQVIGLVLFSWWVSRKFMRVDARRTRIDWVIARVAQ